jgi:hypothetical protein
MTMVELKKPQIKWTEEKKQYLIENYPHGDKKQMCLELGCTYKSLKSMARLLGVKSLKDTKHYKLKILIDDNFYNNYWWGYILADGHINERDELNVTIKETDSNHLKKLTEYLGINLKCRKIKTQYSEGTYCYLTCQDVTYGKILKDMIGITKNKTYQGIDYSWINDKGKFLSVFAGFYDGDGCMGLNKGKIPVMMKIECHYNWFNFLQFCKLKLKEYFDIESTVYITTKGSSALRIYRVKNFKILYGECKKIKLPLMERKWLNN